MYLSVLVLIFSLCAVFAANTTAEHQCNHHRALDNIISLNLEEKSFYLGMHIKANYFEATEFCNYHGMRLATINSQEENDKLLAYMELMGIGKEFVWLSGADLGHEGKFIWMSTGAPLTFRNFMNGQPDNYQNLEHCLEIREAGKWNDVNCDTKQYFVCEY